MPAAWKTASKDRAKFDPPSRIRNRVRLEPLSAPRRTRALAALCDQLNTTETRYPGTSLILRYQVKTHPGTA